MNKILVTGATGLLGSSLVPHLKLKGHEVITVAAKTNADYVCDLSNPIDCNLLLDKIEPETIINLAGLTSVELCEEHLDLAYLVNTRIVENIVKWLTKINNSSHFIQISTDHIYDGPGLHIEDDICIRNNYALTKYAGELAAKNLPCTILRTNFVGKSANSLRESLTDWVYRANKMGEKVDVLQDVYFSPISINQLCTMIGLVVLKKPLGIYNVGSHGGMSKADFDFQFARCLGLSVANMRPIDANQATFLKACRPKNMCMNSSKFESVIGISLPNTTEVIDEVAREYR